MKRLPDSELEIMLVIWRAKTPVTAAYVGEQLAWKHWAQTTVLNFLSRLTEKGYLTFTKTGKTKYFSPLITEETYLQQESKSFLEKLYGSSVKNMVAYLYDSHSISDGDLEELRLFLEQKGRE